MSKYKANISNTPPAPGTNKMLWSPELFDAATGAYPKAPFPATSTYPLAPGDLGSSSRFWPSTSVAIAGGGLVTPGNVYDETTAVPTPGSEQNAFNTLSDTSLSVTVSPSNYDNVYNYPPDGGSTLWVKRGKIQTDFILDDPSRILRDWSVVLVYSWTGTAVPIGLGTPGGSWGGGTTLNFSISKDGGATYTNLGGEYINAGQMDTLYGRGTDGASLADPVVVAKKAKRISSSIFTDSNPDSPLKYLDLKNQQVRIRVSLEVLSEMTNIAGHISQNNTNLKIYALYLEAADLKYEKVQFFESSRLARIWPTAAFSTAIYDEQNKDVIEGSETSIFTTSGNIEASIGGADGGPTGQGSDYNNYDFITTDETHYSNCGTFGTGTVTNPKIVIVFDASLYTDSATYETEFGGLMGGTYSGMASLSFQKSLDNGVTWTTLDFVANAGSKGIDSLDLNSAIIDKTVSRTQIGGGAGGDVVVDLSKLRIRAVSKVTGLSVWHWFSNNWHLSDNLGASVIANIYAVYLET